MTDASLPQKNQEYQALLREVKYRLSYRGTLELDVICRRLLARVEELNANKIKEIRDFLLEGENDLMAWLVDNHPAPPQYSEVIKIFKSSCY